jgi:succinoglycan biosynthesis protein ExoA
LFVTVIIPIRNEEDSIHRSLDTVLAQEYPPRRMEILIADGMSNDKTREIIESLTLDHSNVKLLDNPGRIVPTGLNAALQQAKGEIIIRVDGHTTIAPDYVSQCVQTLERTQADNVGGRMNATGKNTFGKAVALATSTPFGVGGGRFHYSDQEEWVDTVYMGAWPRKVFEKIGLFDEELVRDQDDEFNYRLRAAGGKILLNPDIKSEYTVRSNPRSLWRQYFQYGYWKVRVLQKHPRQMRPRQFVPPLFVLSLIVSALIALLPVLGLRSSVFTLPLLLICATYLLANLTASVYTASKKGWRYLPLLPLVFAILHISYGLGFLVGLVKFWNRWSDKKGVKCWAGTPEQRVDLVPTSTLDKVLGSRFHGERCLFIVDIEGAEKLMLEGASSSLSAEPKPIWMVEISVSEHQPYNTAINPHLLTTFQFFWERGYEAWTAEKHLRLVHPDELESIAISGKDSLFTHNFLFIEKGRRTEILEA